MSKENLVRFVIDHNNPPALTAAQKIEIEALKKMQDEDIDLTDIPELTDDFFRNASRGRFFRPLKESTTVRIDADILAWLKSFGKGYQTRMNALLRAAMLKDTRK